MKAKLKDLHEKLQIAEAKLKVCCCAVSNSICGFKWYPYQPLQSAAGNLSQMHKENRIYKWDL